MACQRSREIDLPAFLAAPRGEEFGEFRLHYPRCPECAAEVRAWTELHVALAASHPEPEQLARYAALAPRERAAVDRHLAGCPSCREELAQLADFDPARLAVPAARPDREGGRLRAWLAGLGRILWHPAFAYALLLLMAVPFAQQLARERAARPLAEQLFAEAPERPARVATEEMENAAPAGPTALGLARREPQSVEKRAAPAPPPARDSAATPAPPAPREGRDEAVRVARSEADDAGLALELRQRAAPPLALEKASPTHEGEARSAPGRPEAAAPEAAAEQGAVARVAPPREAKARADATGAREDLSAFRAQAPVNEPRGLAASVQSEPQSRAQGGARPAAAPVAVTPSPRDLVRLDAWRTTRVHPPQDVAVLRLAIPVPAALSTGEAQVSVSDAGQRRELSERVEVPAAGAAARRVTLHVPRSWLAPGTYRVELDGAGAPPARFTLEVY
jgi:hypothetical protein